jgi:uncharacterized protein
MNDPMLPLGLSLLSPLSTNVEATSDPERSRFNFLEGPKGLRAGWRLLIYFVLLVAIAFGASKIADSALHGREPNIRSPFVGAVEMGILSAVVLLAGGIMAKIEGRSIADYGLPWRRVFCLQFWLGWGIGLVSLAALLAVLRLIGVFSFGRMALHGGGIWKYGAVWAVMMVLAAVVEEFFYRGYMQFTLTTGIGFWPAALATSALMGLAHYFNPGWTVLGLFTVGGFGLIACLLLRRTGDLWMPIGLHAAWNWGEAYLFGIPCSGQSGDGNLFHGAFHGPAWLTGMPFGVEAGWPSVALFVIWWMLLANWFREVKYPKRAQK